MSRYEKRVLRLRNHVLSHENINILPENEENEEEINTDDNQEENKVAEQPINGETGQPDILGIDEYKKSDIEEILSQRGIAYNPRGKKEVLYKLLVEGD